MGRIGCLMICGSLFLLWSGGQGVYTGVTNTKQTEISLADYEKQKPAATWLKLKNCQVNVMDAAYSSKFGTIEEVYIPLTVPDAPDEAKIHVLLATKNQATINLVNQMGGIKMDEQGMKFIVQNKDKLMGKRDVDGTVRFGIDLKDKDRRKLANLDKNLSPDFVILSEGEKPQILISILMVAGGIGLLLVSLFVVAGKGS